jgi:hypothetical protein
MVISKHTPLNVIEIWQPRYKDRKVLVACYKVQEHNKIVFSKAKHLADREFYIRGREARMHPVETNGTISCYAVPMDDLQPLEYQEDLDKQTVNTALSLFNN